MSHKKYLNFFSENDKKNSKNEKKVAVGKSTVQSPPVRSTVN